jgi:anti-sigma factor RsiW
MNRLRQHEFEAEEIMAYLDGELEPQRASSLAAHLEHCAECQTLTKEFRQISERMLDFQIEPSPENINMAVRAAVDKWEMDQQKTASEKKTSRSFGVRDWRRIFATPYGWALACLGIVAAVVMAVLISTRPPQPAPMAMELFTGPSARSAEGVPRDAAPSDKNDGQNDVALPPPASATAANLVPQPSALGTLQPAPPPPPPLVPQQPMIARTASLTIVPANYDQASAALESLTTGHGGYVQSLNAQSETNSSRSISATLRIPAQQLSGILVDLRKLGRVEQESQANTEVTDQYVDVDARLKNARATEQRLIDLLATRTGKLDDVLDIERELANVRGNIESMDAQRTLLLHRVDYATVDVQLNEQYKEKLGGQSFGVGQQIWNALVDGFSYLMSGCVAALIFLLTYGPSIIFWSLLILTPAWLLWRKYRPTATR